MDDDIRRDLRVDENAFYVIGKPVSHTHKNVYLAAMYTLENCQDRRIFRKFAPLGAMFVRNVCIKFNSYKGDRIVNPQKEAEMYVELQKLNLFPHIQLLDAFSWKDRECFVFEYAQHDDLYSHMISETPKMSLQETQDIFRQVCEHLIVLHDHGLAHFDLDPENVLVVAITGESPNRKFVVKLCDLAFSQGFKRDAVFHFNIPLHKNLFDNVRFGKMNFIAPEMYNKEPVNAFGADCYSLGVILAFLLINGSVGLYERPSLTDPLFASLQHYGLKRMWQHWKMYQKSDMMDAGIDLVSLLWTRKKLLTSDIFSHEFFNLSCSASETSSH